MTSDQIVLVRESWRRFAPAAHVCAPVFYERLFELNPECRTLFGEIDLTAQGCKLMRMLGEIVHLLDRPEALISEVARLGTRHAAYGARDSDYESVGAALLWTFEYALGAAFTPEMRSAWAEVYLLVARVMRRAAGRATGEFPAMSVR
ncbi:MAG TPA: globin domain-containing protein [Gemmatimonadales bacterium]|nr:globin domain-containing protein [Gemmatimonadales bacterium]